MAIAAPFAGQKYGNGAVRAEIQHSAGALAIFIPAVRNRFARAAFIQAGNAWISQFLPQRFTPYVFRAPFGYGKRKPAWLAAKLRLAKSGTSGLAEGWKRIKAREFDGWDPWSTSAPPASLEAKWISRNPNRYKKRGGIAGFVLLLYESERMRADLRRWAKGRTKEYAENMQSDGVILPLVNSGNLRDKYSKGARSEAVATQKRCRLTVIIPRADRQSQTVGRVLGTLPYWEGDFIAKNFIANFREMIRQGTISYVDAKVAKVSAGIAAKNDRMETRRLASTFRMKQSRQASLVVYGHD